ncbi:LuxR C-terminal-related transcriptional regulator [Ornithinimicrobium sp. LYQ103]|uniref:helix-turn-helix transcriptional regulator n=1 Tax=Ornithinimicrobium sp. LYQ103 TaxID=3378796 RepID=UPI003851E38E
MGPRGVGSDDIVLLRDIIDLTRSGQHRPGRNTVFELLDRLERLIGSDWINFQDCHVGPRWWRTWVQFTSHGESGWVCGDELVEIDSAPELEVLKRYWWQLDCSLVDRTGRPCVSSSCASLGGRGWAEHPANVEYLRGIDELLLAYPHGGSGGSLRILAGRDEGGPFAERERVLMELLLPHLQPLLADSLAEEVGPTRPPVREQVPPTARQREILHLVAAGMSNRQVGRQLGLSENTVRKHLENVYARIDVQSRTEAVAWLRDLEAAAG